MLNALSPVVSKLLSGLQGSATKDKFLNVGSNYDNMSFNDFLLFFITYTILLFIIIVLGTIIFNMIIPKIFTNIRKLSFIEFFGLYVISHILFC
jgi:hypothetical protein